MKFTAVVSRTLLGLVFMFSGFVKGVDPMGVAYKITDYFIAYNMHWAIPASLFLSILLCSFEFSLGALLFLNVKIRLIAWLTLLLMIFFTVLTLIDAISNPVPDCGCFGDALIITNWQTFYKNIVLMILVVLLFLGLRKIHRSYSKGWEYVIIIIVFFGFAGFSFYNYNHLPMLDFRAWKVGNRMIPENPLPVEFYATYKNKTTGEEKEYLSKDIPWQDSAWMANWEWVSRREYNPNTIGFLGFSISDENGKDVTSQIVGNPEFQFIVFAEDLDKANKKVFGKFNQLSDQSEKRGYGFVCVTSSVADKVNAFREKYHINFDFYRADDTSIEAIIRSNPGLMLMKNGVVLAKWHYHDVPDFNDIDFKGLEEKYLN